MAAAESGRDITQKALAAGLPLCVVPFGRDQFDVARHVEVADAGTRLPASRLRPDRLRSKVREAMGKKDGAERIASAFASAGGPRAATEALEWLLNDHENTTQRKQLDLQLLEEQPGS
jgi:UDP:flavonoid glycosyltransferase YjiC (YdhE family)